MAKDSLNAHMLIDAIVHQTTILIAQLATASGTRTSIANIANQVFLDLAQELRSQGVGSKIIADMFGLALRSYNKKIKRLSESATDRGHSLWEVTYAFLLERGTVSQIDVLNRFVNDDAEIVRGVLRDLVDSGLASRSGRGATAIYRIVDPSEPTGTEVDTSEAVANFVWVNIYRHGPIGAEDLADLLRIDQAQLAPVLEILAADGRVSQSEDEKKTYRASEFILPYEDSSGWEAAVFDHFQALVTTITAKLNSGRTPAAASDAVGGSTYAFDLWVEHELMDEVLEHFRKVRERASELRAKVDAYNAQHPDTPTIRVTFYAGQNVLSDDSSDN